MIEYFLKLVLLILIVLVEIVTWTINVGVMSTVQMEFVINNSPRSRVLNDHPILPIIALGASVIDSAGFGWSGDIDRRGGDTECMPLFVWITPIPKPENIRHGITWNLIQNQIWNVENIRWKRSPAILLNL